MNQGAEVEKETDLVFRGARECRMVLRPLLEWETKRRLIPEGSAAIIFLTLLNEITRGGFVEDRVSLTLNNRSK